MSESQTKAGNQKKFENLKVWKFESLKILKFKFKIQILKWLKLILKTVAPYLPGVGRDGSRAVVVVASVQEEGVLPEQGLSLSERSSGWLPSWWPLPCHCSRCWRPACCCPSWRWSRSRPRRCSPTLDLGYIWAPRLLVFVHSHFFSLR